MLIEKPEVITTEWIDSLIDLYHDPELKGWIWQRESYRMEKANFEAQVARNYAEGFAEGLIKIAGEMLERLAKTNPDRDLDRIAAEYYADCIISAKETGREKEMKYIYEALVEQGVDKSTAQAAEELVKKSEEKNSCDNLNN